MRLKVLEGFFLTKTKRGLKEASESTDRVNVKEEFQRQRILKRWYRSVSVVSLSEIVLVRSSF